MSTLNIILYSNGIENCTVFHQASQKSGEKGKLDSANLVDGANPHKVAREIHKTFSGNGLQRLVLFVPQFRAELPKECQAHQFNIYPSILGKETQEYLRTLFPGEIRIDYAESIKELDEIRQNGEKNGRQ